MSNKRITFGPFKGTMKVEGKMCPRHGEQLVCDIDSKRDPDVLMTCPRGCRYHGKITDAGAGMVTMDMTKAYLPDGTEEDLE